MDIMSDHSVQAIGTNFIQTKYASDYILWDSLHVTLVFPLTTSNITAVSSSYYN